MERTGSMRALLGLQFLLGMAGVSYGNWIAVTNVSLQPAPAGYVDVQFDMSWSNSWRSVWSNTTPSVMVTNWDAAWLFIKFRTPPTNAWRHATLAASGHTAPAGAQIDVTSDGVGAFLYRATTGTGSVNYTAAKLRWNYATNGVIATNLADVSVTAIEMVYVPQGAFYLGSGGSEVGFFHQRPTSPTPYYVTNENEITVGNLVGNLLYPNVGGTVGDGLGPISNAFPKGYNAFYCMKYELTQGQYTEFLNKLLNAGIAGVHNPGNQGSNRQTIGGMWPNFTNSAPDRAANYLTWEDGAAYADWAGLRPMTELEFEKACRGVAFPVTNEYIWGDTSTPVTQTNEAGVAGSGTETALPANANCNNNQGIGGAPGKPTRVGIFATAASSRQAAGASYWGIMELGGDMQERTVTVGSPEGRVFTGVHGDGAVEDSTGDANVQNWPNSSDAKGIGNRGGNANNAATTFARTSDRSQAAQVLTTRLSYFGWRGVRTAP